MFRISSFHRFKVGNLDRLNFYSRTIISCLMSSDELLKWVIILGFMAFAMMPGIKMFLDFLINKPRKITVETVNIMQDVYKRRLKIAKSQKPRNLRKITFLGDEDHDNITLRRIRGVIPDTRFTEFFIKLRWYNWFPIWILVPSNLVVSLVGGTEAFIHANGLRNTGMIYGVVNDKNHAKEEETIRQREHDYLNSLLEHEKVSYIQEESVNNAIKAASHTEEKVRWIGRSELTADGLNEEEETD